MKHILLTAYRRTGKDYFAAILQGKQVPHFKWLAYRPPNVQGVKLKIQPYKQMSYAKALKIETSNIFEIPEFVSDAEKDVPQYIHKDTGALVSARDLYIEIGAKRRAQSLDYWVKFVCDDYDQSPPETVAVITDWRFPNELLYTRQRYTAPEDVVTVRLFRSDVPIPPADVDSEHSLDAEATDILLVPSHEDFVVAKTLFPQYSDYVEAESY